MLMTVQLSTAALCSLSELTTRVRRQLVCLHDMGNWCPTLRSGEVRASRSRHVAWSSMQGSHIHYVKNLLW
jgi:hypothetical protein